MEQIHMNRIVNRVRYDTRKATLIAHNVFWDGNNFERSGRNTWLYRTANGRYFIVNGTFWQGERDTLTPVSLNDAIELYEGSLTEHMVDYEAAFPSVEVEEG